MNRRTAFTYIVAATLVVGLGANSAMAATYPPTTNPEAPVTKIGLGFKSNGPTKTFLTHFNHTIVKVKPKQIVRPAVAGFKTGDKVKDKITLPSGKTVVYPTLIVGHNGELDIPDLYFPDKGMYVMVLKVPQIAAKTITFLVATSSA